LDRKLRIVNTLLGDDKNLRTQKRPFKISKGCVVPPPKMLF